jgi:hypothetical protein
MAKKRTTLITGKVMRSLKPREYIKYLVDVNDDINKVDNLYTFQKSFSVATVGETITNEKKELGDVLDCKDGLEFLVCKN